MLDNEVEFIELTVPFSRHVGRTKAWKNIIKSVTGDRAELDVEIGDHRIDLAAIRALRCLSARRTLAPRRKFSDVFHIIPGNFLLAISQIASCLPPAGPSTWEGYPVQKLTQSS